jgi:hypothetical protein
VEHAGPARRNIEKISTLERFDPAFGLLERIARAGADMNALDSAGNDALGRGVADARQIIHQPISADLTQDLSRVFSLLIASGADLDRIDPRHGQTLVEMCANEPVVRFLRAE